LSASETDDARAAYLMTQGRGVPTDDAATVRDRVGRPSLLVLDPPRAGAGLEVSKAIVGLAPRAVAYVACDPATFARDLKVFLTAGWSMQSLRAFDLFPMTEHVELVAVLSPSVPPG